MNRSLVLVLSFLLPLKAFAGNKNHDYSEPFSKEIHKTQLNKENMILATYYGPGFYNKKTASGERFNAKALTAAHRSLAFGTRVKVINPVNNKAIVVRINDRGPFRRGYSLDLSETAARILSFTSGRLIMTVL